MSKEISPLELIKKLEADLDAQNETLANAIEHRRCTLIAEARGAPGAAKELERANQSMRAAQAALDQTKEQIALMKVHYQKELEKQRALQVRERWQNAKALSSKIQKLTTEIELGQAKVSADFQHLRKLIPELVREVPLTDGCPIHDSPLADSRMLANFRLMLRRQIDDHTLAAWFSDGRIPSFVELIFNQGVGWAMKRCPPEIKNAEAIGIEALT